MHWTCNFTWWKAILLRHLIAVNCRLYMATYHIFQVRDILIYPSIIDKNIICIIRQALMTFTKPGTYGEQVELWIIIHKIWYWIYESRILWWKVRPVFYHENNNHNFLFDKKKTLTIHLNTYKFAYLTGHLTTCKLFD